MKSHNRATDERPRYFMVEENIVDNAGLTPLEGWLYVVIGRHINRKTNEAFPGIARLARMAHMSRASVIRGIKTLESKGLISVDRSKSEQGDNEVNHYHLLNYPQGVVSVGHHLVSDSNEGGISQQPQVVSDSNHNHKKNQPNESNHVALSALIKTWLDSNAVTNPKAYQNTTYRTAAETLVARGIDPETLKQYIEHRRKEAFYADKPVGWNAIIEGIGVWSQSRLPRANGNGAHTPPAQRTPEEIARENEELDRLLAPKNIFGDKE